MTNEVRQNSDIVLMTSSEEDPASTPVPVEPADAGPILEEDRWLGRMLAGRYKIERVLGRGGMGLVLLARQAPIDRKVVVKVLSRRLVGDEVARIRFEREARSLSKLQHPNIVTLFDFGHDKDLPFIVMEYVEGDTLARVMQRKRRLSMHQFYPLALQILAAIGAAHRCGWVHRDLKPDNIMVSPREGQPDFVKVLDFGLARMLGQEEDITKQNLMGTALYLSPEQIQGKKIDQRADVYALGVLFYLLLTGKRPFKSRDDVNLMFQHLSAEPEPLQRALPKGHDIPMDLIGVVHRALAKSPDDRPRDAIKMLNELLDCTRAEELDVPKLVIPEAVEESASSDMTAIITEELTDIGAADLKFLAASFDAGPAGFDELFADSGQLNRLNVPGSSFDQMAPPTNEIRRPVMHHSMAPPSSQSIAPPSSQSLAPPSSQNLVMPSSQSIAHPSNLNLARPSNMSMPNPTAHPHQQQQYQQHPQHQGGPAQGQSPTVGVFYQPDPSYTMQAPDTGRELQRKLAIGMVIVLLALLCGLAAFAWKNQAQPQSDQRAQIAAILDQAGDLVERKKYGEAEYLLNQFEDSARQHPELFLRVAHLRERSTVGRMIIEARQFETQGEIVKAHKSWQGILARSGSHPEAEGEIVRLQKLLDDKKAPEPAPKKIEAPAKKIEAPVKKEEAKKPSEAKSRWRPARAGEPKAKNPVVAPSQPAKKPASPKTIPIIDDIR